MSGRYSLAGRTALVTGGNGGLGLMIALGLREAGARVTGAGRNPAKNEEARKCLDGCVALDVLDEAAIARLMDEVKPDIVVNAAGIVVVGTSSEVDAAAYNSVIHTHLTGSYLCARHAARNMNGGGKIINIGSMYSLFGSAVAGGYVAAKAGMLGLTRSLAVELAARNIQVNVILPGWFRTESTSGFVDTALGEKIRTLTPARRWGQARDIADVAVFLASPASDFVTGAVIPVDGGFSITGGLTAEDWAPLL